MQRAKDLGIELRSLRNIPGRSLTESELQRRNEICGLSDVGRVLRRHHISAKGDAPRPVIDLTELMMRELYEDCQLTIGEIAILCIRSHTTIAMALQRYGIETRPTYLPRPVKPAKFRLTRERFETQLAKGKTLDDITKQFGYASVTSLRIVASILQVTLPDEQPSSVPEAVLNEIRQAGVDDEHAAIVLNPKHAGKGAYKNVRHWPGIPGPALLRYLFIDIGLSRQEIVARLHADWDTTMQAFIDAGISPEFHSTSKPFERWTFNIDELRELSDKGMSGTQIANHLGVSITLVMHFMHRNHLPVRVPGTSGETHVRYDELVSDSRIINALREAGVPLAKAN